MYIVKYRLDTELLDEPLHELSFKSIESIFHGSLKTLIIGYVDNQETKELRIKNVAMVAMFNN